jgi:hypothetical protein
MTIKSLYPTVRPSLNLDFAKTKTLDPRITFTRASTGTYVGADGLIKTAASGAARFDHNPATGESLGLLVEEARTNIIVSSSVFNTGSWVQDGAVLTTNAGVAPDGTTTATSVSQGTGSNRCYHFDNTGAGSKTLTVFAKSNAGSSITLSGNLAYGTNFVGSAVLNTANGTISTALGCSSVAFSNGWYRFIIPISVSAGSGNTNYLNINGPASSVFLWGVQIEAGSFPTSYIPTTSSTVTRASDLASITGTNLTSFYNQAQGTLINKFRNFGYGTAGAAGTGVSFDNSTFQQNLISLNMRRDAGTTRDGSLAMFDATSATIFTTLGPPNNINDNVNFYTFGASFSATRKAFTYNGIAPATVNGGVLMPVITRFVITENSNYAYDFFSGHIAKTVYYPLQLTDAQLQALTAT